MPKFKIGDLMYHPKMPDFYYKVTKVSNISYFVNQCLSSDDSIRYTNQSGPITQVDEDFVLYRPPHLTQIRRP